MYLQKVVSKKTVKKTFLVHILRTIPENSKERGAAEEKTGHEGKYDKTVLWIRIQRISMFFGPPVYGSGSGSESFHQQAKNLLTFYP
jgi:hypothetical protein